MDATASLLCAAIPVPPNDFLLYKIQSEASMSLQVSQALFTPHLAGGFKLEEAARS